MTRGEHIHHGYFIEPTDTKEVAQTRLIDLLVERSGLAAGSTVLDVGCGIGGTARYLAKEHGCKVIGITISGQQVRLARKITLESVDSRLDIDAGAAIEVGSGSVRFVELDAETMGEYFDTPENKTHFDCVWISEAMSHLPNKELFFRNAATLLSPGGKLVIADWFKAEVLTDAQLKADIQPIEGESLQRSSDTFR